ncbi:MAG: lipoprotein signal peptidase [Myxococcota bacterium]|jgi:lipoprotein signal peptidase
MLVVVVGLGAGLDQASKWWADASLGTVEHPLPVHISEEDAGKTVRDVLRGQLDLSDELLTEIEERGPSGLTILFQKGRPGVDAPAFPEGRDGPRLVHYWVFHHRSLKIPPRRIPSAHRQDRDLAEWSTATLGEFLKGALPYLGDDAMTEVANEYVYPAVHSPMPMDRIVKSGEIYLLQHRPVEIIAGFTQLKYAENPGAAWGLLSDLPDTVRRWFFFIVSIIAMSVLSYLFFSLGPRQHLPALGFATILSGAVGNFIDRLRFNYVIDFIDMYVGGSHWPTYNIADVAISLGVGILLVEALVKREQSFLAGNKPGAQDA